jgi:hypothetical protein
MSAYDFEKLFASSSMIQDDFNNILENIIKKEGHLIISDEESQNFIQDLVIYDALDGGRTTLTSKSLIKPTDDVPLFSIGLIHTLRSLGAKSCIIMIHTSYNRERGRKEFERILNIIKSGAEIIKQYSLEHDIRCRCLCLNKDYELADMLLDIERQTRDGAFNAYFLFDYNEEWFGSKEGREILDTLPDIDVHIRHTKFNFSGGWIPGKMHKSAFLYSQNGAVYSNWESDELVALVVMALLAKKFNQGEGLSKVYPSTNEIKQRYRKREVDIFQKTIQLKDHPKKLFTLGSPIGLYQIYY